jgi:hypothetical protein
MAMSRAWIRMGGAAGVGAALLGAWCSIAFASPLDVVSDPASRRELHVTAYRTGHDGTAFLREIREVEIPAGEVRISVQGVPDTVERETVHIRVLEGPPVEVLEQTFGYDVLTPEGILHAAEGADIVLEQASQHTGALRPIRARVIAASGEGAVYRTSEGFTFGIDAERARFLSIPERMTPRPTLRWHARSAQAGKRTIEISYLMSKLRWNADYLATVSSDGRNMDLSGWVTFENQTDVLLERANLAVAAGTVHRSISSRGVITLAEVAIVGDDNDVRNEAKEEALAHLHLYKIPERTNLEPHSIKNVRLLSLSRVPITRRWSASLHIYPDRHDTTRVLSPRLELELRNDKKSNAGIPIPAGAVRVMVPDRKGTPHMVAATSVQDTPADEKLTMDLGTVADVRIRVVQTEYRTSLLGAKEAVYALELRSGVRHPGIARVDLHAGGEVQLEVIGATVTRPSAATWRVETPLTPGVGKKIRIVARKQSTSRSSR